MSPIATCTAGTACTAVTARTAIAARTKTALITRAIGAVTTISACSAGAASTAITALPAVSAVTANAGKAVRTRAGIRDREIDCAACAAGGPIPAGAANLSGSSTTSRASIGAVDAGTTAV